MGHLPVTLARAQHAVDVAQADSLLDQLQGLLSKSKSILQTAEQAGDLRTALMGIREARGCLELLAELEGELDRRPQVNLLVAPEWLVLRDKVFRALEPHPAARIAVAAALTSANGHVAS